MSLKNIFILSSGLLALSVHTLSMGSEGIELNPQTGDYTVRYKSGYSGKMHEVIFVPATKIDPILKSKFKYAEHNNVIIYEYKIRNNVKSQQNLDMLLTHVSSVKTASLTIPKGWHGSAVTAPKEPNMILSWSYGGKEELGGLPPGRTLRGFAVESYDLPGVAVIKITGASPVTEWLGHYPAGVVGDQMDEIEKQNYIGRFAAVPLIPVPSPFDAATVLTSLQKHVKEDLVGMALIDPVLASKLDPLFVAAIDAAQRGNAEGARKAIKDIRHLLKREHEDIDKDEDRDDDQDDRKHKNKRLIDKLAAKVLDFDLKYVEKRVKGMLDQPPPPVPPPGPTPPDVTPGPIPPPDATPAPIPPRKTPGAF